MIKRNLICFRTIDKKDSWSLSTYKSIGGYKVIENIVKNKISPQHIINEIKTSCLRGRGGAGFPTGIKWSFIPKSSVGQKYVICNSDEGEPGTCKDRDIMRYNPHQLIEGMMIAAYVMGATIGYNYIRREFYEPSYRMEEAVKIAKENNLLGKNLFGSDFCFDLFNVYGSGAYICGEETALMESLEGKKGQPRFKPPFPANFGLYGKPSNINNTETYASVPVILEKGGEWFLKQGKPNNGGFKLFSVSGHVNKPGNFEIPLGTPFKELLRLAGGMRDNSKLKCVIPGGSSMPVLPADIMMKTDMDYDSIKNAGSMLGSGAVIIMDDSTCIVNVMLRIAEFYMDESCGQCTPCREGTGWMTRIIHNIAHGEGKEGDIELLENIAENIAGRTICALGDAAAWPVQGFIRHYREEILYNIRHKKSKVN
jgi:NADH-quinone oxidoreductase subunit F